MALKADREVLQTEIGFYMNEAAERGLIACYSTSTSGINLDATANLVTISGNPSGAKPLGLMLEDMVDVDLTLYPRNYHKAQQIKGEKVALLRKGWVVTNKIEGTPTVGSAAYLGQSGYVNTVATDMNEAGTNKQVGTFGSTKDEDGYARISVDL